MEYKIFGAARSPGDEFRMGLQAFCDLDQIQREALGVCRNETDSLGRTEAAAEHKATYFMM